jgi:acyl-CoA thioesterase FadM
MKSLKYGERFRVEVYLVRVGRSSLTFGFEVVREDGDILCARVRITNATIDRKTFKAIPCPADLRDLFLRYYEPEPGSLTN